ncbi:hypothetical protein TRFO_16081 [Tritrichomonas foetus]|uniref:Uncharacterized protein n=1 Tax=Tritrichomonas foetus TaxID=1144522 RepID=A0A1J4KW59_9EUKA|nr:hypothetical protein TRFO_16081 [Tritrichomonas foetus]|eukprot:OHT13749.1 hypothetical protein TRFO_16081 [Tritrichomonas foetus]
MESYKCTQRTRNVIAYFAQKVEVYSIENEENSNHQDFHHINSIGQAIECIHNGVEVLRSCHIIENELMSASNNNISCQSLLDTGIIGFILPYAVPDADIELLESVISIIDKITFINQPLDSPLQNPVFLHNFVSIIQKSFSKIKLNALNIISNLLHDENISKNVFEVLSEINLIQILWNADLFNSSFTQKTASNFNYSIEDPIVYSSGILSDFAETYDKERVSCLIPYLSIIINNLNVENQHALKNFVSALSYILRSLDSHQIIIDAKVPKICIRLLSFNHEAAVSEIFDCFYRLEKKNNIPNLLKPKFARLCTHILETSSNPDILLHIIRFLDLFIPKHFNEIDQKLFIDVLINLTEYQKYKIKIYSSLVLVRSFNFASDEIIFYYHEKKLFDFIFSFILSYQPDDVIYILHNILSLIERNQEMKELFVLDQEFKKMLEEVLTEGEGEVTEFSQFLIQSFYTD